MNQDKRRQGLLRHADDGLRADILAGLSVRIEDVRDAFDDLRELTRELERFINRILFEASEGEEFF